MKMPTSYSLLGHGELIATGPRIQAYARALKGAIRPGCVVVDVGAGTGIFALLACQYGASHVHAVEPDDSILLGRAMAAANGYEGRITFHQCLSTQLTLETPADVIISDLRGVVPLLQHHIPAIIDARHRLLAERGVLIARCDTLRAALVDSPQLYQRYAEPWLHNDLGLDLRAAHRFVCNSWRKVHAKPEQLLSTPQTWATLDYHSIDSSDVAGDLVWTIERGGTAHGFLLWFDTDLGDGIGFSNAPDQPELLYGQAFFPLEEPVGLAAGDKVRVQLRADLVDGDYIWSWNTDFLRTGDVPKAGFRQSTFYSAPLSMAMLKEWEAGFIPHLSDASQLERDCLALVDGTAPLGDIAHELCRRFPNRFARWQDALTYVSNLVRRS